MPLNIRKVQNSDIEALCSLMKELSGHAINEAQMLNRLQFVENSEFDSLYLCEEDHIKLGLFAFRIRENLEEVSRFGEISAIVVNPNVRNKGVGRFMIEYGEKLAMENGCIGMWLVSGFGSEKDAHNFYKHLGFNTTGYRFVKLFDSNI